MFFSSCTRPTIVELGSDAGDTTTPTTKPLSDGAVRPEILETEVERLRRELGSRNTVSVTINVAVSIQAGRAVDKVARLRLEHGEASRGHEAVRTPVSSASSTRVDVAKGELADVRVEVKAEKANKTRCRFLEKKGGGKLVLSSGAAPKHPFRGRSWQQKTGS